MVQQGKTWWGRRFVEGLETFTDPGRLARGRQYLAGGRVLRCVVTGNRVQARVRGKVNPYLGAFEEPIYESSLEFKTIPDAAWNQAIRHMGGQAGFLCRLLVDEMPDEIETPLSELGLGLLPRSRQDVKAVCSCPDPENPCKHLAGLYYLLAGRLDQDPFLLFELRGLPRAELANRLKATPLGAALASALTEAPPDLQPAESFFTRPRSLGWPESVEARDFWRGGKRLPPGVEPAQPAGVTGILVRKGGDFPAFWDKDESFVETMAALYEHIRKKASKDWL